MLEDATEKLGALKNLKTKYVINANLHPTYLPYTPPFLPRFDLLGRARRGLDPM